MNRYISSNIPALSGWQFSSASPKSAAIMASVKFASRRSGAIWNWCTLDYRRTLARRNRADISGRGSCMWKGTTHSSVRWCCGVRFIFGLFRRCNWSPNLANKIHKPAYSGLVLTWPANNIVIFSHRELTFVSWNLIMNSFSHGLYWLTMLVQHVALFSIIFYTGLFFFLILHFSRCIGLWIKQREVFLFISIPASICEGPRFAIA